MMRAGVIIQIFNNIITDYLREIVGFLGFYL